MPQDQETRLQRAAATFILDREVMGCTRLTIIWYRDYIGRLIRWLTARGVLTPEAITLDTLRAYVAHLQGRGLAPKTVHHHVTAAKTFCKWLTAEKLIPEDPAARLPRPKVPKKVLPALTKEDVGKLLAACENERDKALLLFMLDTGARCGETVAVNVGDVDLRTGAVTIAMGKGQKGRTVYLGAQSRRAVQRYLLTCDNTAPSAPLWISQKTGGRLTTWGVLIMLRHMGQRAGVHCHPHLLRRTFAIWSLRAGMDVARLAALLGHSDLATVQKYLALIDSDLAEAHAQHGAVDSILKKGGKP